MTKKHEELVGRIVHGIEMYHRWASQGTTHHDTSQRIAEGIIASILSAVRDGLEIPGEVGRIKEMQAVPSIWCQRMCKKGAAIFIALRPPTGTGKEEKASEATDMPRYCEHCGSEEHYTSEHY